MFIHLQSQCMLLELEKESLLTLWATILQNGLFHLLDPLHTTVLHQEYTLQTMLTHAFIRLIIQKLN